MGEQRRRESEFKFKTETRRCSMLEAGQSEFGEVETPSHILGTEYDRSTMICLLSSMSSKLFSPISIPTDVASLCSAVKLANWLEHYAEIFELNMRLSLNNTSIDRDPATRSGMYLSPQAMRRGAHLLLST